jgi:hypothetical protein
MSETVRRGGRRGTIEVTESIAETIGHICGEYGTELQRMGGRTWRAKRVTGLKLGAGRSE